MKIKIVKMRSLTGKLPGWGTTVDDGYITPLHRGAYFIG